jgi:hypothetical protein
MTAGAPRGRHPRRAAGSRAGTAPRPGTPPWEDATTAGAPRGRHPRRAAGSRAGTAPRPGTPPWEDATTAEGAPHGAACRDDRWLRRGGAAR